MKIVHVSYNNQPGFKHREKWLEKISIFSALMEALSSHCQSAYVKYTGSDEQFMLNGVEYRFIKTDIHRSLFPLRMNRTIRKIKPDIVIIAGLRYPLQIIQLRLTCGNKVKLIGRHHADKPPTGFRKILQRWADRCLNAYFFTSLGNANEWIDAGIIKHKNKIHEINAASTNFSRLNKQQSRERTGMSDCRNFLWVGRLDTNKDPITVLKGFEQYLIADPGAQLHMIYQEETLLQDLTKRISKSSSLKNAVKLIGFVPYQQLQDWYSAADYFISGSHSEGGSFALLEAMACGCIPIVSNIPAAIKMIDEGRFGIIFKTGDEKDLAEKLLALPTETFSSSLEIYFQNELSNKALAEKIFRQCEILMAK